MNFNEEIKKIDPDVQAFLLSVGSRISQEHSRPSPETSKAISDLREHNAEQFQMIKSINDSIHGDLGIIKILEDIKAQTIRTNGRVTKLESWRSYLAGGMALFCLFGLPMIWMLINDVRDTAEAVNEHIAQTK